MKKHYTFCIEYLRKGLAIGIEFFKFYLINTESFTKLNG